MKLVKIEETWHKETWINIDSIALIQKEGKEGTHIFFQNNYDAFFNIPIEKVLQAIGGSKEHRDFSIDKKGNIKNANC